MSLYGYARVSTLDQYLAIQRTALKSAGCEVIRAEKASGARRDGRTELQILLDFLRTGDTLVVTRIDRLARSLKDLQDIVHELKARGVALKATSSPSIPVPPPARRFSTCSASSLNSRPICAVSDSSKGSALPRRAASTKDASRRSTLPKYCACAARRNSGRRRFARRLGIGRASVYRLLGKQATSTNGGVDADPA